MLFLVSSLACAVPAVDTADEPSATVTDTGMATSSTATDQGRRVPAEWEPQASKGFNG